LSTVLHHVYYTLLVAASSVYNLHQLAGNKIHSYDNDEVPTET